ncbi:phage major capsid protein, HK97 family [Nitrosomonas aestuarii]|uniref:Phage major capsid protein, HK97 family n=1 Tax=Nitrosomonas aestuarii TaxID=52441 RepID=A0A1I4HNW9_9PROT|nr:phage major capsid protein [Nitrosomonas aestuarii]SFL43794.1 phage major capsid protein, HK97 family [Nitrosomonas aestuarii]
MTGKKAVSSNALVPNYVSSQVIDDVRAQTTVIQAGSGTIVIDGPTNLAKITGDPTVYEHTEGSTDITESDITHAPVSLNPKALVALIPLSMEVVADSPNLDAALNTSLSAAFAAKLDSLALATILADTNIPDSSVGQDPAIWLKCLEAVGEAMAVNQPIPVSMIGNTADFIARASQLASTTGSWLGKPTSASHVLVAHMRGAGVVLQPKRLFIQKKTVV